MGWKDTVDMILSQLLNWLERQCTIIPDPTAGEVVVQPELAWVIQEVEAKRLQEAPEAEYRRDVRPADVIPGLWQAGQRCA
jgi:hypothetical protein